MGYSQHGLPRKQSFICILKRTISISGASIICALLYAPYTFLITFVFDHLLTQPCLWYVLIAAVCALIIGVFAVIRHKENIVRLLNGEEKQIHAKK